MLDKYLIEDHIKQTLKEDIGFGDITTEYLMPSEQNLNCELKSREQGIFCGKDVFSTVFNTLSEKINIKFLKNDGDSLEKGDVIAKIEGPAKYILLGERTALNYVQRMSGIATETNKYVKKIEKYKAKIADTRKTTPLFRVFEKYSVKTGGGNLHRYNLSDCAMIKDNHIVAAGGVTAAVNTLKKNISHAHKIEVECDTKSQVIEALNCGADIIMLDNMSCEEMQECVKIINGKAIAEASGNVTLETVESIAKTGVDIISTSAIVAKAMPLDLGLDCK